MYSCPSCGGDLQYDISLGKLKCAYCESAFLPTDPGITQSVAEEETAFEAKVFTCPQCGGEMYSTDLDATAFCSYCGASNVLESRLQGVDRPQKIIPFTVTKEACAEIYKKNVRKAIFAPGAFRNPENLERMRPLYVPYRLYDLKLSGNAEIHGRTSHLESVNRITSDYSLKCKLDAELHDVPFDAASAFDDTIAQQLAPFDMGGSQEFESQYLAGAYANIPDVDTEIYRKKTLRLAAVESLRRVSSQPEFAEYELYPNADGSGPEKGLPEGKFQETSALFPVWFLSFRSGKRVCYAAVNGQTGKIFSDLPVSLPKFFLGSLLLSVPLFILLNLFLTLRPMTGLLTASLFALITAVFYSRSWSALMRREEHADDAGYRSLNNDLKEDVPKDAKGRTRSPWKRHVNQTEDDILRTLREQNNTDRKISDFFVQVLTHWPYAVMILAAIVLSLKFYSPLFLLILTGATAFYTFRKTRSLLCIGQDLLLLAVAGAFIVRAVDPVSDLWYYGSTLAIFLLVLFLLTRLILHYNLLSSRPLPLLFHNASSSGSSGQNGSGSTGQIESCDDSQNSGSGKSRRTAVFSLLILLLAAVLAVPHLSLAALSGTEEQTSVGTENSSSSWTSPETGFTALVSDAENLLSTEEKQKLLEEMKSLTQYGNVMFASVRQTAIKDPTSLARNVYERSFGSRSSGTLFLIDMGARNITLFNSGSNYDVISRTDANVITDNVYRFASGGKCYEAASEAFRQSKALLEGRKIARPMKYINNALLALILSIMIMYLLISSRTIFKTRSADAMPLVSTTTCYFNISDRQVDKQTTHSALSFTGLCTVFLIQFLKIALEAMLTGGSGGGGGSHGSGGHSGGGHSGGGGGHSGGGSHKF